MNNNKHAGHSRSRSLSTLTVMGSTLATRILGYVKMALIAQYFGGSGLADVVNAVFSIPNNLRKLMAEGALTTAFIPTLSKHVVKEDKESAVRITRQILAFQYVVLIPFIIVSILSAPMMIKIFVTFPHAEQMVLAGKLYAWFIPYLLMISVAAVIMAVLNTHNHFLLGALSPLFFSIAVIIAIVFFTSSLGAYSMVLGVLVGGLGQVIIQYPLFRKMGYRLWPKFDFKNDEFRMILKRYMPALVSSSIFAINQQVAVNLSTGLADGSASALSYSIVFFQLPLGIFSAAVNTVFYPQLAKAAQGQQIQELAEILKRGLYLLFIFLLPSAMLMSLLANEIISVALMRGKFTAEAVLMTASTLIGYLSGIFFLASYNFIQRYFYAKGHFVLPLISAIIASVLDIALSLWLIRTPLGVAGLAYANSIAFFIGFVILFVLIVKDHGIHLYKDFIPLLLKVFISLLAGYGVYALLRMYLGYDWWCVGGHFWTHLLLLFVQGGLPAITILIMYILFRMDMIKDIFRLRTGRKGRVG